MSWFAGARSNEDSVEYTAINYDLTDGGRDTLSETQARERTSSVSLAAPASGDQDARSNNKTKEQSYRILELSQAAGEEKPDSNTAPTIPGWPQGPRQLRGFSVLFLVGDILLICLPVAFLVLAISAWRLDGDELSEKGRMVERAMNLGPTIYPLAFAAIGSRCLRCIAIRLAEKGTTIATLEKLLGSQSLVSALSTASTLRSVNLISIGLLFLWALSPLGGQSSLRLLHEGNSTTSEAGIIYYSDHAAPMDLDESDSWFTIVPTILSASLASSAVAKAQPVDLWNHPKVPRLDVIENRVLGVDNLESDWVTADLSSNLTYSSFAGINVQGLRPNAQSSFETKYNYLRMGCKKYFGGSAEDVLDHLWNSTTFSIYPPFQEDVVYHQPLNTLTNVSTTGPSQPYVRMSFLLRYGWNSTGTSNNETTAPDVHGQFKRQQISFLYGASFDIKTNSTFQVYECTPHVITVDAHIDCQSESCVVSRLRRTAGESTQQLEKACDTGSLYRLGCLTMGTYTLRTFFQYFPLAMGALYSSTSINPFDDWIAGSNQTYRSIPTDYNRTLSAISDQMISDRLTMILNTYWQAVAWGTQVTRAGAFEIPEYSALGSNTETPSYAPDRWLNTTEAVFRTQVLVYKANIGWIVTLLLITVVLLLLGIINVVVSVTTKAPDLFYYASSLARENPYTNTPDGGTTLDGADRSRLLKNMTVQIADVSPEHEVGYVVLRSVSRGEDRRVGKLRKGRLYW